MLIVEERSRGSSRRIILVDWRNLVKLKWEVSHLKWEKILMIRQRCYKSVKWVYKSFRKGGKCPRNLQVVSFLWITSLQQMAFYEMFYILLPPKYWLNSCSYQQPLLQSNRFKEFKNCINRLLRDNHGSFRSLEKRGKCV